MTMVVSKGTGLRVDLQVSELTKRYSKQVLIGPISFEVYEGEFFSLLGPSGCGKTTTLRCVAGFETPTSGSIHFRGDRLDDKPPHRRDVGLVFQDYALFPHLTIFENIAFGLRLRRVAKPEVEQRVGRMLELISLPHVAGRYPAQLSGGQQQRVAIARSLVLEPRLLLFDEPLSNLDYKMRIQMRSELRSLQRELGKTSIYVTHDQSEALALSDRIAVLAHGHIEQIGTPAEIYESPASSFVADFIGSSNLVNATVISQSPSGSIVETPSGVRLHVSSFCGSPGAKIILMVRPERIELLAEPVHAEPSANATPARIEDISYLGHDLQLRVLLADQLPLNVTVKNGRERRALARGDLVVVGIDPHDIHPLSR